jgi:hypothetical protein
LAGNLVEDVEKNPLALEQKMLETEVEGATRNEA